MKLRKCTWAIVEFPALHWNVEFKRIAAKKEWERSIDTEKNFTFDPLQLEDIDIESKRLEVGIGLSCQTIEEEPFW